MADPIELAWFFDEQQLWRVTSKFAWGSLTPSPLVKLRVEAQRGVPQNLPTITIHGDACEVERKSSDGRKTHIPPIHVVSMFVLSPLELTSSVSANAMVSAHIQKTIQQMSYRMREHDPRFGTIASLHKTSNLLPRSPLFDPGRIRPPAWRGAESIDSVPCAFCQNGFGAGYPAMWGGGNILWVHSDCWWDAVGSEQATSA